MEAPKMLSETQFNEILTLIPNTRDRANLTIHKVLCDHKLRDLEEREHSALEALAQANAKIRELELTIRELELTLTQKCEALVKAEENPVSKADLPDQTPPQSNSGVKEQIIAWLRAGPGNGDTVRAKFAAKLAQMLERDAHLGVTEYQAY